MINISSLETSQTLSVHQENALSHPSGDTDDHFDRPLGPSARLCQQQVPRRGTQGRQQGAEQGQVPRRRSPVTTT